MKRSEEIDRLRREHRQVKDLCSDLLEQVCEANLKIRFILQAMKVQIIESPLLDPATNLPKLRVESGYTAYLTGGRDQTLAIIEKEVADAEATLRAAGHDGADRAPRREGNGAAVGAAPAPILVAPRHPEEARP